MKPKDQNYSKSRRLKNQIKAVVTNPYNVIVLIAIVLLTYLIVLPLLDMISTSFTLAQKDARLAGGAAGDFTLYYWQRLLGSSLTKQMLLQPAAQLAADRRLRIVLRYHDRLGPRVADGSYRSSVQAVLLAGCYHPVHDPQLV